MTRNDNDETEEARSGGRPTPTLQSRILHQRGCTGWIIVIGAISALLSILLAG